MFVGQRGAFEGCGHARVLRSGSVARVTECRRRTGCAHATAESSAPLSFCLRVAPRGGFAPSAPGLLAMSLIGQRRQVSPECCFAASAR
ncbi:uncharacterized protein AruCF_4453 [Achromobacter ruhlandii]|nr:uncharacterized protein AruCF_4453 [Achromobacter ruhlandii]